MVASIPERENLMKRILALTTTLVLVSIGLATPMANAGGYDPGDANCLVIESSSAVSGMSCTGDISIPNGVSSIGEEAFFGPNVTSITIPASVELIDVTAFAGSTNLESITVVSENLYYKSIDGVLFNKVADVLITFPSGRSETSYTIPGAVVSLGTFSFFSNSLTGSITIPASVTSIGISAFPFSAELTSINVEPGNSHYKSIDGVLFNEDATVLIAYPSGKLGGSYIIPNGVTTIESQAFRSNVKISSITFPASLVLIGIQAFDNTSYLSTARFLGDAPEIMDGSGFYQSADTATAIINAGATGFDPYEGTGKWKGLTLQIVTPEMLNAEAAAAFDSLVAALPTVGSITLANAAAIASARAIFSALSDDAKAQVTALATLVLAEEKIESLSETIPSDEQREALAREAARAAVAAREAAKQQARSALVVKSKAPLTLDMFASADIAGITANNLEAISAEIEALPTERRSEIGEILKIARKFEVVDKIAAGIRVSPAMFQEIGLIALNSPYKTSLISAVRKMSASDLSSYEKIQAIINAQMKKIQERKDRIRVLQSKIAALRKM